MRDTLTGMEEPVPPRRELLEYLEVPLRRPLSVLLPWALVTLAAVAASFALPKRYQSSTLILVESEKVPDSFITKTPSESLSGRMQTLKPEILSRTRLERVLVELDPYPEMRDSTLAARVETMRAAIGVSAQGRDAFSIDFVHTSPHKAMEVANRLASLFIEETAKERAAQVQGLSEFLQGQLDEAGREIEAKEEGVRRYKESRMGSLPEQLPANLAVLQRLQLEQQATSDNLRAARERLATHERDLAALLRGDGTAGVGGLDPLQELRQTQAQLAQLRSRYTDEHPEVRAMLARIAGVERRVSGEPGQATPQVDPAAAALRVQIEQASQEAARFGAKLKELDERIALYQQRVEETPRIEQALATLTRDFQKLKENYLALLAKRLDVQMAERLERKWKGEQFRILDPAPLPEHPVFPKPGLFLVAGLILGLGAGLLAAYTAEFLDHSIKTVSELENVLSFSVLVSFPHVDPRGQRKVARGARAR